MPLVPSVSVKIRKVGRKNAPAASFLFHAWDPGVQQLKALTDERRAEPRYAVNRMMMPYSPPTVRTLIPGDCLRGKPVVTVADPRTQTSTPVVMLQEGS